MELYIVSYDISVTKLRNKIAKLLEGYGMRVQYSVFECELKKSAYDEMIKKIKRLIAGKEDVSVSVYHICKNCSTKISIFGDDSNKYISGNSVFVV